MVMSQPEIIVDTQVQEVIDDPFEALGVAILTLFEEMKKIRNMD